MNINNNYLPAVVFVGQSTLLAAALSFASYKIVNFATKLILSALVKKPPSNNEGPDLETNDQKIYRKQMEEIPVFSKFFGGIAAFYMAYFVAESYRGGLYMALPRPKNFL